MRKPHCILDIGCMDTRLHPAYVIALREASEVSPNSPEFKTAAAQAVHELAVCVLAQQIIERDAKEMDAASAQRLEARRQYDLEQARAPWVGVDVSNFKSLDHFWSLVFRTHLMSIKLGADGRGSKISIGNVNKGLETAYAYVPSGHAMIRATIDIMQQIALAHNLPPTLTWQMNGDEFRLYRSGKFKRHLMTNNVAMIGGDSCNGAGYKMPLSNIRWIVPPNKVLLVGEAQLPELPADILSAFKTFSTDAEGVRSLEQFVLGR